MANGLETLYNWGEKFEWWYLANRDSLQMILGISLSQNREWYNIFKQWKLGDLSQRCQSIVFWVFEIDEKLQHFSSVLLEVVVVSQK